MWGMVDDRNKYVRCLKKRLVRLELKKRGYVHHNFPLQTTSYLPFLSPPKTTCTYAGYVHHPTLEEKAKINLALNNVTTIFYEISLSSSCNEPAMDDFKFKPYKQLFVH